MLRVRDVEVRVCADDNRGTYLFRCPHCDTVVVKDAEPRVVDLLLAAGVTMTTWATPLELTEHRSNGPSFTHDDLLGFQDELQRDDWFDRFTQAADGHSDEPERGPSSDLS